MVTYSGESGRTVVRTESGENDRSVLFAIVRASYELAAPVRSEVLTFDEGHLLSDDEAGTFVRDASSQYDRCVIEMRIVGGRRCATHVKRLAEGTFELDDSLFRCFRGDPKAMFDRAKALLSATSDRTTL